MKPFNQFFAEEPAEKQTYVVTNVYVRGSRVTGETLATSEKKAVINVIMQNLTDEQRRNPYEHIRKALDLGGYKVQVKNPYTTQRDITNKIWGPLLRQHVSKGWTINKEANYPIANANQRQTFGGMENWKGIIVQMSPDKFLSLALRLEEDEYEPGKINRLIRHIKKGGVLDPLYLRVDGQVGEPLTVTGHEGRHRAKAAKALGIESVPVLICPYNWPRVPEWTPEMRRTIEAANFTPES